MALGFGVASMLALSIVRVADLLQAILFSTA